MTGLLNGPMFRMFTYRQVALFGALLVAFSIYTTSISNSFTTYLITFSILYGTIRIFPSFHQLWLLHTTYFDNIARNRCWIGNQFIGQFPGIEYILQRETSHCNRSIVDSDRHGTNSDATAHCVATANVWCIRLLVNIYRNRTECSCLCSHFSASSMACEKSK